MFDKKKTKNCIHLLAVFSRLVILLIYYLFRLLFVYRYHCMSTDIHQMECGPLSVTLCCRRGMMRSGTRYNVRGADEDGEVANEAEIEQIVVFFLFFLRVYVEPVFHVIYIELIFHTFKLECVCT